MRLVYEATGLPVQTGDIVEVSGEFTTISYITKPHKPSSTGRVGVRAQGGLHSEEYFPGVVGAKWIEREDQPWNGS